MAEKVCRVCFKKATKTIGIFSAKGIKLNIVEILRLHFLDEVNTLSLSLSHPVSSVGIIVHMKLQVSENDDILPKFICTDCWNKLNQFHDFYNTVAEAKTHFLANLVKIEETNFKGADVCEDDMPPVKTILINEDGPSSLRSIDDRFEIESLQNQDFHDFLFDDRLNDLEEIDEKIECEEIACAKSASKYDPVLDKTLTAEVAAVLAKQVYDKTSKTTIKQLIPLFPQYIDMICKICETKFDALCAALHHYRDKHHQTKIYVKCCQKLISVAYVRDHILHHLNPDVFK